LKEEPYHFYLHYDPSGESYNWNLDTESFTSIRVTSADGLREELISRNVGILDLKYLDTNKNNQSELQEWNIQVWNFRKSHFNWLIQREEGKIKYIEINSRV
jgi:hypothetical protein